MGKALTIINDSIIKITNKPEFGQYSFVIPDWIKIDEGYVLENKDIIHIYNILTHLSTNYHIGSIAEEEINTILKVLKHKTDINFVEPTEKISSDKEALYKSECTYQGGN